MVSFIRRAPKSNEARVSITILKKFFMISIEYFQSHLGNQERVYTVEELCMLLREELLK